MRELTGILVAVALVGALTSARGQTNVSPAASTGTAAVAETSDLAVKRQIEEEQKRRKVEKERLEQQLRDANTKAAELRAIEEGLKKEVPALEKSLDAAKARLEKLYQDFSKADEEYRRLETQGKEDFQKSQITEIQSRYDEEHRTQKAAHEKDMAFIADNKWKTEDFERLVVPFHSTDKSLALVLEAAGGRARASGCFPTVNFSNGAKTWHALSPGAGFTVEVQKQNPFVADVAIHPGLDALKIGSTNAVDWDVHIYVAKDFRKRSEGNIPHEMLGVAWPVDIGRRLCWQAKEPPVFEPVSMPERKIADDKTPEVMQAVTAWKFLDVGGEQKRKDADNAVRTGKHELRIIERMIPIVRERVKRKLADVAKKIEDQDKKVREIKMQLREYEEDLVEKAAAAGDTNVVKQPAAVPPTDFQEPKF